MGNEKGRKIIVPHELVRIEYLDMIR